MGAGMFPTLGELNVLELEKEFQELKKENGDSVKKLFYNRGL